VVATAGDGLDGAPRPTHWPRWAHPALAASLFAFLVYLPALGGGFLRDDHFLIEHHPYLRATGWLGRLLLADFWAPVSRATGMWRPVVVLSYWVDGRLGHWAPFWFHLVNVVANALATGALALLLSAAGIGFAATLLAAMAFAVMPAHVECVAWISGRTDVFCALFGLAALWLDARAGRLGRTWPGVLAPLALALSMLSKEVGVTLGGVLAVQAWSRSRAAGGAALRTVRWLVPYAVVTAIYVGMHLACAPDPGGVLGTDPEARGASGAAVWALFPGYLAFLWPWFPHSPDRTSPAFFSDGRLGIAVGALAVAFLAALMAGLAWRRARAATPVALMLLPLLPTLVIASTRGFGVFGERHMYLPSAGIVWVLALVIPALASRLGGGLGRIAGGLAVVLVLGSEVGTVRAIRDYRDDRTMYLAMTERDPRNPGGFLGLAVVLTERGQLDDALAALDHAAAIDPGLAGVYAGRARVAARREAWADVLSEADRALALAPHLQAARVLRAVALLQLGRLPEAGRDLDGLRAEYPDHPGVGAVWGQYLIAIGRPAEALVVLRRAATLLPDEATVWDAIGMASASLDHREDARAAFEHVVAITPRYVEGWMRLAASCHRLGDMAGRDRALARAAELPGGRERVEQFLAPLRNAR
jgi:Flp pilus assembly protein TadD